LPEMFTSGFTMNPKAVAETMQEESILWLQTLAKRKKCYHRKFGYSRKWVFL